MPTIEIDSDGHLRRMDMLGLKVVWQGLRVAWASAKPRAIEEPHRGAEQSRSNNFQDALIVAAICPTSRLSAMTGSKLDTGRSATGE